MNIQFNEKYAGVEATAFGKWEYVVSNGNSYLNHIPDFSGGTEPYSYILTGWVDVDYIGGNTYYQTTSGVWITEDTGFSIGNHVSAAYNGQKLINKIIKNNQTILERNLFCARYANKLTASERDLLYQLQARLQERNNALLNKELIQQAYTSYPAGYANEASYLEQFMNNGGKVGVVLSTTAVIVISAVVVASLSAAAYFAYKAFYNESEDDVKYSEELTQTLMAKLTPEEWEQLKNETQGIVTKARIKQSLGTSSSLIGIVGWGFAAFAAYKFIMPFFNKNKKKDGKE